MDSLDYEALRCAHVNVVSEAIKERGMNNMLAERIKDFLNRLVREHGSIDLNGLSVKYTRIGFEKCGMCEAVNTSSTCFPGGHKRWSNCCEIRMGPSPTTTRVTSVASPGTVSSIRQVINTKFFHSKKQLIMSLVGTLCWSPFKSTSGQDSANWISEHCNPLTLSWSN
ncbi:Transcriptional activator DEMETER [Vitis vinifera]|uniref:Transcriptional activator DEMETER n=1 Tax=Vitis vinifera TaxID=29760 RepID=A0A438FKU5_VITVI|nr:Transcriptional activator DEMETER [Vitis vinifera]